MLQTANFRMDRRVARLRHNRRLQERRGRNNRAGAQAAGVHDDEWGFQPVAANVMMFEEGDDEDVNTEQRNRVAVRSRARDVPVINENELCVACRSAIASCCVCMSCFEDNSQDYNVWRAWIEREQIFYRKHLGCTYANLKWENHKVIIQQGCVVSPELLLLKRVKACIGWAVHGLVFEFLDGTRTGIVFDIKDLYDDEIITKRRSTDWFDVSMGDYICGVRGFNLLRNHFLCHTLHLDFASGRTISFVGHHEPWRGGPFGYTLPENALLRHISFTKGRCVGLTASESVMHLPLKSPSRANLLPKDLRSTFHLIQLIANRIDRNRIKIGERPLGRDLWTIILCEYLMCCDLQRFEFSAIGKMQGQQQQALEAQQSLDLWDLETSLK